MYVTHDWATPRSQGPRRVDVNSVEIGKTLPSRDPHSRPQRSAALSKRIVGFGDEICITWTCDSSLVSRVWKRGESDSRGPGDRLPG